MKWFIFSLLASFASAFQPVAINAYSNRLTRLCFYPEQFQRAQECATHYGTCNLDELERLADELEAFQCSENGGELQDRDCYVDTERVTKMLRA